MYRLVQFYIYEHQAGLLEHTVPGSISFLFKLCRFYTRRIILSSIVVKFVYKKEKSYGSIPVEDHTSRLHNIKSYSVFDFL